jgi:hypothetical protein
MCIVDLMIAGLKEENDREKFEMPQENKDTE